MVTGQINEDRHRSAQNVILIYPLKTMTKNVPFKEMFIEPSASPSIDHIKRFHHQDSDSVLPTLVTSIWR